ncbi:oxidoreductase [Ktedonospora formicarum]|uniref:Short-chain dehydrogenase/reductase n=1 Tax=Ktedonospora formicarum TaxID=2778364 RepID=A0A8J3I5P8_9CHLR|nr:oxidoreductase [Ktedonospora formicarum]GHO47295.1 short-chain dehydrogenase/reductase [Ktedonospora formicarum]
MASNVLPHPRVWFITGCSTGFGRALAEAVLAHGDRLVATARHPERLQDLARSSPAHVQLLPLDVTDPHQGQDAAAQAAVHFGRIDVLVNNAGYGLLGAVEEATDAETRQQLGTNFFGTLHVTRAILPFLRQQRSGHILMMASVDGFIGETGAGIYNASKFAIEGMSEALAQDVAPLGIHVTLIEPGYFRTDFTGRSLKEAARQIEDYAQTSGVAREQVRHINGKQPGDPKRAAQAMIQVVETAHPPLRLVLGADALERVRHKLQQVKEEVDTWEPITVSTAFDAALTRPSG